MNTNSQQVPVAVIGVGRMGRHHARTYAKMPQTQLLAVVDANLERAEIVADDFGCDACESVEQLLEKYPQVQAASVAVPTRWHMPAARPLIEKQIACLIEKPLAATSQEAREIAELAKAHQTVIQVGHTERFNPAVRAVSALGYAWRFMEVQRVSPMTFRSLDVGVVMDMMIHDLDIILTLANSEIKSVQATGVAVLGEHEDIANARITFANGCVANVTASRLAMNTTRKLRTFSESGYVSLDYQNRSGVIIEHAGENREALGELQARLAAGQDLSDVDYSEVVNIKELSMDIPEGEEDQLTAELTHFIDATVNQTTPVVDALAGSAAVDAAERVVEALQSHRWEGLAEPRML